MWEGAEQWRNIKAHGDYLIWVVIVSLTSYGITRVFTLFSTIERDFNWPPLKQRNHTNHRMPAANSATRHL
jgi:hypothetical protein